jgi:DNA-binding PadR family transcriptional regulator
MKPGKVAPRAGAWIETVEDHKSVNKSRPKRPKSRPKSGKELLQKTGYGTRTGNFKRNLAKLIEHKFLEMTIPDKPQSRLQKYRLTEKGKQWLAATARAGSHCSA